MPVSLLENDKVRPLKHINISATGTHYIKWQDIFGDRPVELRDDLANSLGCASGSGDDVLAGTTTVPPQLAGGAVHSLLCGSDGVDCALDEDIKRRGGLKQLCQPKCSGIKPNSHHQALNDAEVVIDNFG